MPLPSTNLVDAVSGEEVCPLCFDRYSGADACTCVVCRVASCPSCAELLEVDAQGLARELNPDGAVRCFACRPAPSVAARELADAPLSLPRPIQVAAPAQVPAGLPALPFPLTTSPRGVRVLKLHAPGTVFVGLPPVAPVLSQSSFGSQVAPRTVASAGPLSDPLGRLAGRARQKLLLLTRLVALTMAIAARAKPLLARLQREGAALSARLPGYRDLARARISALGGIARTRVGALGGIARTRVGALGGIARARVGALGGIARTRVGALAGIARARLQALRPLARTRLGAARGALAAEVATLRARLAPSVAALRTQLADQLARLALLARGSARIDQPVAKPKVVDPSRPIHL